MKNIAIVITTLIVMLGARAQAPTANAVATKDEPHHHLVLENAYVRVLHFELAGHDTTLLHMHDLPYLSVTLGPADFINAVSGKPEAHATLADAQVGYSKGGFAHSVRAEAGTPVQNFTVELLKPQGAVKNLCLKIVADAPAGDCPHDAASDPKSDYSYTPDFETEEMLVESGTLGPKAKRSESAAQSPRLFLILDKSRLTIALPGSGDKTLHAGEAFWVPAGAALSLANPEQNASRFLAVTFRDGGK